MTNQGPEDQRSASLRKKQKYIHNHNTHIIILSCKFIKEIFLYLTRGRWLFVARPTNHVSSAKEEEGEESSAIERRLTNPVFQTLCAVKEKIMRINYTNYQEQCL